MLTSALGKYSINELPKEAVDALDKVVAEMFNIEYIYREYRIPQI